jgi:excisionase family DNA binding protein
MVERMTDAERGLERWLTLSAAARFMGVHPSTLRDWAERGLVAYLRTPGGHRRFAEADLHAFVASNRHASLALVPLAPAAQDIEARTLRQIHSGVPTDAQWRGAHDPTGIEHKREQGRRLLGLALQFVSRQSGREVVLIEAEELGRDYGRDAALLQLPLPETVRAFYFFRDSLIRATRPSAPGDPLDAEDARIHADLHTFLDVVFFAMLAAFEDQQRHFLVSSFHPQG